MKNPFSNPGSPHARRLTGLCICISLLLPLLLLPIPASAACAHTNTYRVTDGCDYAVYCRDCGSLVETGVAHSRGQVVSVSDRSADTHTVLIRCDVCMQEYELTESHREKVLYSAIDRDTHIKRDCCEICDMDLVPPKVEAHTFSYGRFTLDVDSVGNAIHTRYRDCHYCRYADREEGYHEDKDHDGSCDVCETDLYRMSVTLPTQFPLALAPDGTSPAVTGEIRNASNCRIRIVSVELKAKNGWTAIPYATEMANEKVDAKKIGVSLSGAESASAGASVPLSLPDPGWLIPAGSTLPLEFRSKISALSYPVSNADIASLVFTVRFAPDENE